MLQRSKEWFDARLGRFTASEINKILGVKGLGKTGESLCFDKAIEKVFGSQRDEENEFVSFDMRRGVELEPVAFGIFKELKALDFIEVQEATFFPYKEDAGASPDGLVGKDECLEIKCPRLPKFLNLLIGGAKEIDEAYYDQMQMQMLCTNSLRCHFMNFVIVNSIPYYHIIIVERDENRISFIKERLNLAIQTRNKFIEEIKSKLNTK